MRNDDVGTVSNDVYYDVEKRKIILSGDFTERNARDIIVALHEMEGDRHHDPIDLFIFSGGGDVEAFLAIYDTIQALDCEVNTIALGKAYSAGAYLLLSGTGKRLAYENALIMLHEMRDSSCGTLTDMRLYQVFNERIQHKLNQIVAKHTGQPLEKVATDLTRDVWMLAEEALEYGIVDGVIKVVEIADSTE